MKIDPAKFARIVEETPDGVMCLDDRGVVSYANPAAERIFQRDAGELTGKRWEELVGRDPGSPLAPGPDTSTARTMRAGALRPDGSVCPIEVTFGVHDTAGQRFFSGIVRDLSTADRALSAEKLAGEREAFLASVAHQLRAPIQPILTSLRTIEESLRRGRALPADALPGAVRQTLRLSRLVDALLRDATSLERGELEVDVHRFDLAGLAQEIVDDFRAATDRPIELHRPVEPVMVESDPVRLHQILIALIDNALKYSPRNRRVVVDVDVTRGFATLAVLDEGVGIPEAEQSRVFSKFYRASNAPDLAPGLGLGLYLAHGLAERLRGRLGVVSHEGKGSTFLLTIPLEWPLLPNSETRHDDAPAQR